MKASRLLGHVLLWGGFFVAALAMVANKEVDLLPLSEQKILHQLDRDLKIPKQEFGNLQAENFAGLNESDLQQAVETINHWFVQYQTERKTAEQKKEPMPRLVHPLDRNAIIAIRTGRLNNLWSTIDWKIYGAGALIGLIGVVLLRSASKSLDLVESGSYDRFTTLEQALEKLQAEIAELIQKFDELIPEEVVETIDDHLVGNFANFADARNAITHRYGLSVFADVMSEFAIAERYTNRAWSAAADGYMDEAKTCIAKSSRHLQETTSLLEQAKEREKKSSPVGVKQLGENQRRSLKQ